MLRRFHVAVVIEKLLKHFLTRTLAGHNNLNIAIGIRRASNGKPGESDHVLRQFANQHGVAHIEQESVPAL
ncbi:hypothetical protein D3C85_1854880 [compost metagenome]